MPAASSLLPPVIPPPPAPPAARPLPKETSSARSWASILSETYSELKYIELTDDLFEEGALKIPKEVLARGMMRMEATLVAQFVGSPPLMRVLASMAHLLWGYEGNIAISTLSPGFFLVGFPSKSLCDWVLARSWHIHHMTLVLR
ncbi:hypothetical protein LINGRAHAP2_LOCUS34945 [Linum grandiflorum]